ncbi:MAG: secondary thiamine-phosphate synthase enzyme YjbQ [bacterium]|nr:secondary thiamine-phosphate synthase enzyme YjbQ [bacterium]
MVKTEYIVMNTEKRKCLVHITDNVRDFVRSSGIKEGMVLVSAMHITAGIIVNDYEAGLWSDIMEWLEKVAPEGDYAHHQTGEDNGDAHLKRIVVHHQVIVPITKGALDLGPWERIFYAEFDGRRSKRIILKAMGE